MPSDSEVFELIERLDRQEREQAAMLQAELAELIAIESARESSTVKDSSASVDLESHSLSGFAEKPRQDATDAD